MSALSLPAADPTENDSDTIAPAVAAAVDSDCHSSSANAQWIHSASWGPDDHVGTNATIAVASAPSDNAAATTDPTRPHPSPASRLYSYRHALESVLAFSDRKTLAAAVRVTKEWARAVGSMRALSLCFNGQIALIESVAASAIGRHVSDLELLADQPVSADAMSSIGRFMPHLRSLQCFFRHFALQALGSGGGSLVLPPGLRELQLLPFCIDAGDMNVVIQAAGRLEQLESLTLKFRENIEPLISFAPLAALPLLRTLAMGVGAEAELTDAQVAELRALPRLERLDVTGITTALMRRLLAQPHDLQWQEIALPYRLSDDVAALLPQLPSLTALRLVAKDLTHFDFLQRLPNLASVIFISSESNRNDLAGPLAAGLQHCANVTELCLHTKNIISAAHLADLLPRLPRLHSLTLSSLSIDSLIFLAQAPMASQLTALRLSRCKLLPVAELRHLHSLRGLHELDLSGSFNERMDPDHEPLVALRAPSAALPLLRSFSYRRPY